MKTIKLTKGFSTIVDDDDFLYLSKIKWQVHDYDKKPYAVSKGIYKMHRVIMKAPRGLVVDHINGNTLDNRKENLRIVTVKENNQNRKNRSGLRGVYCSGSAQNPYISYICLGRFKTKDEAHLAYNLALDKLGS